MIKQTVMRRLRIDTDGVMQRTSFVFPFFDRYLQVRFFLVVPSVGHVVLLDNLNWEKRGLLVNLGNTGRRPLGLNSVDPENFHDLFHFDPWWTMRRSNDVQPVVRDAIIATNLAARRLGHLQIRDLVFDDHLDRVEEVLVGDGVFRPVPYSQIQPMPQDLEDAFFGRIV